MDFNSIILDIDDEHRVLEKENGKDFYNQVKHPRHQISKRKASRD